MDREVLRGNGVELAVDVVVRSEVLAALSLGRVHVVEGKTACRPINPCLHMVKIKEILILYQYEKY